MVASVRCDAAEAVATPEETVVPVRESRETPHRREPPRSISSALEPVYFLSLTLENVRGFGAPQTIDFAAGRPREDGRPAQFTFIIGDNAAGKTTLLQSLVALAPVRPDWAQRRRGVISQAAPQPAVQRFLHFPGDFNIWETLPRRGQSRSRLSAVISRGARLGQDEGAARGGESVIELSGSPLGSDGVINYHVTEDLPDMACIAYGAARRSGTAHHGTSSSDPTASLFSDDALLRDAEEWLAQADYWAARTADPQARARARLDEVHRLLSAALIDVADLRAAPEPAGGPSGFSERPGIEALTADGWLRLGALGQSVRTPLVLLVDLASRLYERHPDAEHPLAESAVALIDEIDLHLHPVGQRRFYGALAEWFPNVQFVATAQSPLVVATSPRANLVVLRRDGDRVLVEQDPDAVKAWRIQQLLVSDVFDGGVS